MIINESRINNKLPRAVDSFLQDFAQVYADSNGEGISYDDILKLSDKWGKVGSRINGIISKIKKELKGYNGDLYELSGEDPAVKKLCDELVKLVKS